MINLPVNLNQQFDNLLLEKEFTDKDRAFSKKWLHFYWDFCHKYHHDAFHTDSLPLFMQKLQDKNQSEQQQHEANQAVSLFFRMQTATMQPLISTWCHPLACLCQQAKQIHQTLFGFFIRLFSFLYKTIHPVIEPVVFVCREVRECG